MQFRTILVENHHSFRIMEHNPLLYERARDMAGLVAQALKQASREATILLCAPVLDRHLEAKGPRSPTESSASITCRESSA